MAEVLEVTDVKAETKPIMIEDITEDDDWQLDAKMCRLDGHTMAEGELCEACQ